MVLVKWDEPKVDDDVVKVEIYSSATETGVYTLVITIDSLDGNGNWITYYDDISGTSTTWYKIRFLNTALTAGQYSTARQVGYKPFVTLEDFRQMTNFNEGEISDYDFQAVKPKAYQAVLDKITVKVKFESLAGIVDGSNKEFTTKHKPFADTSLDQLYGSADVEVYYAANDAAGNLSYGSTQTVTSINQFDGIITMTSAPALGKTIYGNYGYYRRIYDDLTLREATIYYAAYLCSRRLGLEKPENWLELFNSTLTR